MGLGATKLRTSMHGVAARALVCMKDARLYLGGIAVALVWAYLDENTTLVNAAALLLGSLFIVASARRALPKESTTHFTTVALQCAVMNLLGTVAAAQEAPVAAYALGLVLMQAVALTHPLPVSRMDGCKHMYSLADRTVASALFIASLAVLVLAITQDEHIPMMLVTLLYVASLVGWNHRRWHHRAGSPPRLPG